MKAALAYSVCFAALANGFQAPMMATRAVNPFVKPKAAAKKAVKAAPKPVKKAVAKVAKAAAPVMPTGSVDRKYPTLAGAESFKIPGISGGGNKAPPVYFTVPDFSDPKLQIERDPAFYAAAAQQRIAKKKGSEFFYDDGLTDLERRQRAVSPAFLTGSAKSQADSSAIVGDINVDPDDYFGLGPDRFQLLFISVFGLFTLVGCLSGTIKL